MRVKKEPELDYFMCFNEEDVYFNTDLFVKKNEGRGVDFDNMYGNQCMDLARQFIKDVWQIPQPAAVEGAWQLPDSIRSSPATGLYLTVFTLQFTPKKGDLLVWNKSERNPYGHVAVFLANTENGFLVFHQDGFQENAVAEKRVLSPRGLSAVIRKTEFQTV